MNFKKWLKKMKALTSNLKPLSNKIMKQLFYFKKKMIN